MAIRHLNLLWKVWYPILTRLTRNTRLVFLNYGYASETTAVGVPALQAADEPDRACIQLYDHVAHLADLRGLDVLEVSCGHGGGASYVARYLKPRTLHAVDRNPRAIELCRRLHHVQGLEFSRGNALALPFADGTFDAVINIEASHCYPDVARFFREVARVLRPGGHFLFADFRESGPDTAALDEQVNKSGLEAMRRNDISADVVRGMNSNNDRYHALIKQVAPRFMSKLARRFAGVKGSQIYNELESGKTVYLCYHLKKQMTA